MSDQTSIFNGNAPATQPNEQQAQAAPNAPAQDPYADLLNGIVNERGERKYATLSDALHGLKSAQEYIPQLKADKEAKERELDDLRKKAERAAELERTLEALTSQRNEPAQHQSNEFDESKIADLVNRQLTLKEQQALAQANVQTVVSTLQQSFGADAEQKLYGKAEEMGMSVAEMNALAARSPKAVLTMLGITQAAPAQKQPMPSSSSQNSAAFAPHQDTFIGRNPKGVLIGATTQDVTESFHRAKKMVEELDAKDMSIEHLSIPSNYYKYFGKK